MDQYAFIWPFPYTIWKKPRDFTWMIGLHAWAPVGARRAVGFKDHQIVAQLTTEPLPRSKASILDISD